MYNHNAFTLIELLVVISIIVVLASVLLAASVGMQEKAASLQVSSAVNSTTSALLLFRSSKMNLPAADNDFFMEYDHLLDIQDPLNNTDSVYATWPVLNKLVAHSDLHLDHELLEGDGSKQRFVDHWGQDIRYVTGNGKDDNEHQPQGSFPNWNWDSVNDKPLSNNYPYVYSYGVENPNGDDLSLWVYATSDQ